MALADTETTARRGRAQSTRPGGYHAEIATAPSTASDTLKVVIPSLSGQHQWTTSRWAPSPTGDLPLEGDTGLVVVDERATPHLVAWYPAAS